MRVNISHSFLVEFTQPSAFTIFVPASHLKQIAKGYKLLQNLRQNGPYLNYCFKYIAKLKEGVAECLGKWSTN